MRISLLLALAVGLLVTGVAMLSVPAAFITAGLGLGCVALLLDVPDKP